MAGVSSRHFSLARRGQIRHNDDMHRLLATPLLRWRRLAVGVAACVIATGTSTLHGDNFGLDDIITNFNFAGVPLGSTPPTTFPSVDPIPQSTLYAIGGFPDTGPVTGTVQVQNALTIAGQPARGAVMTTTQGGTGAQYLDTQFLVTAPLALIQFDLNIMQMPATGLPQPAPGAPNGQAFAVNVFGLDSQRLFRFAVTPTSATGGDFGIKLPDVPGTILPFGSFTLGETHHFQFLLNFAAGTVSVYLNGVFETTQSLLNPGSGISEIFMFQNGVEGVTNQVAIGNIMTTVPEPGTVALLLLGGAALARHARRRR